MSEKPFPPRCGCCRSAVIFVTRFGNQVLFLRPFAGPSADHRSAGENDRVDRIRIDGARFESCENRATLARRIPNRPADCRRRRVTSALTEFDETFRARLRDLFVWRRDVRRFRRDPLPSGTLEAFIELACLAPSVGLSQPWRFVIVDDDKIRAAIGQSSPSATPTRSPRRARSERRSMPVSSLPDWRRRRATWRSSPIARPCKVTASVALRCRK